MYTKDLVHLSYTECSEHIPQSQGGLFFFFRSSHSHLSSIFENRNPCVEYLLLILSSHREKKKVKTKKECIGMSGIVTAETQLMGI